MTRGVSVALLILLAGSVSSASAADEYYLYKPEKVQSPDMARPGDALLTKVITIQRGDTLSRLSRKYSGRGAFFPQILLFNRIKNPDLIYTGDRLRVPVTLPAGQSGAPVAEKRGMRALHQPTSCGCFGNPVPIMLSRVTSSARRSSLQPSVPAGRMGSTR